MNARKANIEGNPSHTNDRF